MNNSKNKIAILLSLVVILAVSTIALAFDKVYQPKKIFEAAVNNKQAQSQLSNRQTDEVEKEILEILNSEYLRDIPSTKKLQDYKNKGLIASLEDPYSEYFTTEEQVKLFNNLNQKYKGIGIKLEKKDDRFQVNEVIKGSPAEQTGVKKGDTIVKVGDYIITTSTTIGDLVDKIRGPEDTQVKIQFFREGKLVDLEITRRDIKSELIKLDIDGSIAVITISSFGEGLDAYMQRISREIVKNTAIKRIIIDVRSNTGGLLNEVIEVLSYFVPNETLLVKEKGKSPNSPYNQQLYSNSKDISLGNYELMVLTDRFSASASEIVAGALRDQKSAKIIGEKTFGKGVVQKEFPLRNKDFIKVTIAEWLTPKDTKIDKVGIEPDIKIQDKENALDIAKKL